MTDHGDLLDVAADQAAEHDARTNPRWLPLADWTCANGHDNPWRSSRCGADCDETIDDQGER